MGTYRKGIGCVGVYIISPIARVMARSIRRHPPMDVASLYVWDLRFVFFSSDHRNRPCQRRQDPPQGALQGANLCNISCVPSALRSDSSSWYSAPRVAEIVLIARPSSSYSHTSHGTKRSARGTPTYRRKRTKTKHGNSQCHKTSAQHCTTTLLSK